MPDLANAMHALLGRPSSHVGGTPDDDSMPKALALAAHTALTTRGFKSKVLPKSNDEGSSFSCEYTASGYAHRLALRTSCRGDRLLLALSEEAGEESRGKPPAKGVLGLLCSRYMPPPNCTEAATRWDAFIKDLDRIEGLVEEHLADPVRASAVRKPDGGKSELGRNARLAIFVASASAVVAVVALVAFRRQARRI